MEPNNLHQNQEFNDDKRFGTGYVTGYPVYQNPGKNSKQSATQNYSTSNDLKKCGYLGAAKGIHHQQKCPRSRPVNSSAKDFIALSLIILISIIGVLFMLFFCTPIGAMIFGPTKVKVNSMSVSPLNITADCQIVATWNITFLMKPGLYYCCDYSRTEVSVYYRDEFLSGTVLGPIQLSRNDYTLFQATIPALSRNTPDWLANAITTDKEDGIVQFNVQLGAIRRKGDNRYFTRVSCKGLNIGFSSGTDTGEMLDKSTSCNIDYCV